MQSISIGGQDHRDVLDPLTLWEPGATTHDVSTAREFITEQMLPILQGEKATSLLEVVGCIIYCAPALQVDVESGQQELVSVQPELHYGCDAWKSVE